jgi:hypothetical protein
MAEFVNEFAWSRSRDALFTECKRKYWFNHYGMWGGWNLDAPPRVREIYVLKQLRSRQMWAGEIVHRCIQRALDNLRSGIRPLDLEDVTEKTLNIMRADFSSSRRRVYRTQPKTCALIEHEYNEPVPDGEWRELAEHVRSCLAVFYRSGVYRMIAALPPDRWLEVEEFSHFTFEGTKVHVKLDFSCRSDGGIAIYDWKTGRSDDPGDATQRACYTLYAMEQWGGALASLAVHEFHLATGKLHSYPADAEGIAGFQDYLRGSLRDMRELLRDPGKNEAAEEDCVKIESLRACRRCQFRRVCGPKVLSAPDPG